MADEAVRDPRPGGVVRWTHANGDTCSGTFVELVPDRRVVFSAHDGGWRHYLDRLRRLAAGDAPGADPFATTRVPTPTKLRTQR
jgi:uncharacterized protein YndB with AHSA1/START domain